MAEADHCKLAFVTPDDLYEFNVMPFGFCNVPATFERMMDITLGDLKWQTCLCYLTDIVVFTPNFQIHMISNHFTSYHFNLNAPAEIHTGASSVWCSASTMKTWLWQVSRSVCQPNSHQN